MHVAIYRFRIDHRSEEAVRLGNQELLPQMRQIPGLVAHYAVHVSDDESLQIAVFEEKAQLDQFEKAAAAWLQQSLAPQLGHPYNLAPLEVIHGNVKAHTTPTHQYLDLKP
ncbi:MAG TPA: hypothetical protein VF458_13170 [Ktedonobacteraceae bacterium]